MFYKFLAQIFVLFFDITSKPKGIDPNDFFSELRQQLGN